MKIKVGVSQRIDTSNRYAEDRDTLDQRVINWVMSCDFLPVPVPNSIIVSDTPQASSAILSQWLTEVGVHAILLTGGNDLNTATLRDTTERLLLSWAEKYQKPVLGICRGMQVMGVYSGVKLKKVVGHAGTSHNLIYKSNNLVSFTKRVNSYHDFVLSEVPKCYKVSAYSEDGEIEAMVHKTLPWQGWMWHPERETSLDAFEKKRFIDLVNNGRK